MRARLLPVIASAGAMLLAACASPPILYWTEESGADHVIKRYALGNKGPPQVVIETGTVHGIAVDQANAVLYWSQLYPAQIRRLDLATCEQTQFPDENAALDYPLDVALDESGHRLFWADSGRTDANKQAIQYAYTDGRDTLVHDLAATLPKAPAGIEFDPAEGRVYWMTLAGTLWSLDPTPPLPAPTQHLLKSGFVNHPYGLAIREKPKTLYWTNGGWQKLGTLNLKSNAISDWKVFAKNRSALSILADPVGKRVYWSGKEFDTIDSADLDGRNTESVTDGKAKGLAIGYPPCRGFLCADSQRVPDVPEPKTLCPTKTTP
jgi:DNA-binding beta-propeller fold protein YncE